MNFRKIAASEDVTGSESSYLRDLPPQCHEVIISWITDLSKQVTFGISMVIAISPPRLSDTVFMKCRSEG